MKVTRSLLWLGASFPSVAYAKETWLRDESPRVVHQIRQTNGSTSWPYGPFSTRGRDIVNSRGDVITWAGVNWPLSGETMIPEGLEHASVESILDRIASVGFNIIRMPYAIQMIDEIRTTGADPTLSATLTAALGTTNGTRVLNAILANNPIWTADTPRLKIWSDLIRIAQTRRLLVHPDAHVSRAGWCCSHTDGNAWFDDTHFNTTSWRRGLAYVASWARNHTNVVGMSLRNEVRESWSRTDLQYNWVTFVGNMSAAADAVHAANPDLLITWGGLQYGQDVSALTAGTNLYTAPCYKCTAVRDALRREPVYFNLSSHAWANKLVWEVHLYGMSEDLDTGTCRMIEAGLYRNGFNALGLPAPAGCNMTGAAADWCRPAKTPTPVILSEFGRAQDQGLFSDVVLGCLREYTTRNAVSWMMWSLAGSYRIRSGGLGVDDTWGLTNFNWTGWRFVEGVERFWRPWVESMNLTKAM